MKDSKPRPERHPIVLDGSQTPWYEYALRRLPRSLFISIVALILVPVVALLFLWAGSAIYGWLAG